MTRKDLVDGSEAYKNRKFADAEAFFRSAIGRDPNGETLEGKTAQVFLARTLHSEYIGNRSFNFSESDFVGTPKGLGLTEKIRAKGDPLSQWLFTQISPNTWLKLDEYEHPEKYEANMAANAAAAAANAPPAPPAAPGDANANAARPTPVPDPVRRQADNLRSHLNSLAGDLNRLIAGGQSIYDQARFSKVTLSDFTKQYMAQQLTPDKTIRLNRLLLEDAYPGDIQKRPKAEDAIAEYQKALVFNPNDQSSYKAVASLYENLQRGDDWLKWVTARSQNMSIPAEQRAEALTSLAARKNTCANEITDTEQTKKTVTEAGKQVFKYVKPANAQDFETLKGCVAEGMALIDQAMALEPADVKNAGSLNVKGMTDQELAQKLDLLRVFESARSYKASLEFQAMHVAEMAGNATDRDRLKTEAEAARTQFLALSDIVKNINDEVDERKKAKEAETTGGAKVNANNANKK